jgi:TonB family protein
MQFRTVLLGFALTPLFAQHSPTPAELAAQSLQEATSAQDPALKLQKLDEAYKRYQEALRLDARNRDAYYSLGVIDWMKCHPALEAARTQLKDPAVRKDLRMKYGPIIEDGISNLDKALEIDAKQDNVMTYRNLLIRERATLEDSPASSVPTSSAPPAPPAPPFQTSIPTPQRIRVGGNVIAANLIRKVEPVCPPNVRAHTSMNGRVQFSMIIDKEGHVANLQLLSGNPLLIGAAMDAVRQWVYKPTLLNGTPVEVMTQIDVAVDCIGVASAPAPQRVEVSAEVQSWKLISKVDPVYPQLAVQARVQGTIRFTAIIDKDGHVSNLQLIGGHPLLVQAAQDAVRQWIYRPTFAGDSAVEVVTQIYVVFTLPPGK